MHKPLYSDLVSWYRLLDPVADHRDEAAAYQAAFERVLPAGAHTLLELGSGAGHNAFHLKRAFECTLSDISQSMLGLSRELNPECVHVEGDMRKLRLEQSFDAVLVHDAVVYMLTREDVRAAALTAFVHTRPGGAAIFAPDCVRERFMELSDLHEGDDGQRSLRCMAWMWDPDPGDDTYTVEYAFLLRDGAEVQAVHDRHVEGLFSQATWLELLSEVGFEVELLPRPFEDGTAIEAYADKVFFCRRPH